MSGSSLIACCGEPPEEMMVRSSVGGRIERWPRHALKCRVCGRKVEQYASDLRAKWNAALSASSPAVVGGEAKIIAEVRGVLQDWIALVENARRPKTDSNTAFVDFRDLMAFDARTRALIAALPVSVETEATVWPGDTPPSLNAPAFEYRDEERVCINGCLYLRADFAAQSFPKAAALTTTATASVEVGQIVAWLRADADLTEAESRKIIANSHSLSPRDIQDWRDLVATKRGIADAIERGAHRLAFSTPSASKNAEHCQRCGHENAIWFAPSPLWNAVMRAGCIDGEPLFDDMVCAACFMSLAQVAGIATMFRVTADEVMVPLQTVTPSGRVWDDVRGLWVSPDASTPSGEQGK